MFDCHFHWTRKIIPMIQSIKTCVHLAFEFNGCNLHFRASIDFLNVRKAIYFKKIKLVKFFIIERKKKGLLHLLHLIQLNFVKHHLQYVSFSFCKCYQEFQWNQRLCRLVSQNTSSLPKFVENFTHQHRHRKFAPLSFSMAICSVYLIRCYHFGLRIWACKTPQKSAFRPF